MQVIPSELREWAARLRELPDDLVSTLGVWQSPSGAASILEKLADKYEQDGAQQCK